MRREARKGFSSREICEIPEKLKMVEKVDNKKNVGKRSGYYDRNGIEIRCGDKIVVRSSSLESGEYRMVVRYYMGEWWCSDSSDKYLGIRLREIESDRYYEVVERDIN